MGKFDIKIKPFGNKAILVEWPNKIDEVILDDIIQFTACLLATEKDKLNNHTPGYNSLLLQYTSQIDVDLKKLQIQELYESQNEEVSSTSKCWHIPVCYDEEFGLDLSLFSHHGITKKGVIELHTSVPFRIYMVGFLPGFLYLGGLPKELHLERKETPRLRVPKGSVAVGGEQTGVYPMESPGGWQIIGRTPLTLFDLNKNDPTPIRQGDNVQFYAINSDTYQNLSSH